MRESRSSGHPPSHAVPATGIRVIDAQHAEIMDEVAKLDSANAAGHGAALLDDLMVFLEDYTETHFAFEEFAMKGAHYPDFARHREHHQEFKRVFGDYRRRFHVMDRSSDEAARLSEDLASWLHHWLEAHISHDDTLMAEFLQREKRPARRPARG